MVRLKDGFSGERSIVLPPMIVQLMEKDPLLSLLHITDIGYYPKAVHHFRERTAPINQYVFIYCIDGKGWYRVNDRQYAVSANQYFILPANVPHAYGSDDASPWTIYWIHFRGVAAPYYIREESLSPLTINPEKHSRISHRINLFEEIFHTLNAGYSMENLHYAASLFHYYLGSLRYIHQYREAVESHDNKNIVETAVHYMKENIEKDLSLKDIADYAGYSTYHFSKLFKKEIGHAPMTYFNLLKIRQACVLLDSTDMKVNQICFKTGIEDVYYFSRLFRKIMGISPTEYRNLKKG